MKSISLLITVLFALSLVFIRVLPVEADECTVPEYLNVRVYSDGFVLVEYGLESNTSVPSVTLALFGQLFEDIIVVDGEELPLDFIIEESNITVFTLGAERLSITYFTQDLTSKIGRYWTLEMESPVSTKVILPPEARITGLSQVPDMIESSYGQVTLVMPDGLFSVTYVLEREVYQQYIDYTLPVIAIAGVGILIFLVFKYRGNKKIFYFEKKRSINIKKIFEDHTDLRPEETEVIKFLCEKNGEAFEAEIYKKIRLPRTTTWRMINRMVDMEIVKVSKVRKQNLVILESKY